MFIRAVIFALLTAFAVTSDANAKDQVRLNQIADIYQTGDAAKTIKELKSYLSAHSDDDIALTMLGHAYKDTGKNAEAGKAYKEALRLNPKRVEAMTGLGMLARIAKKYDESMKWYEKAIRIDPKYAQAYSSIVTIALKRGNAKKAVSMGEKSVQLDRKDPVLAANLAIAYHYDKQIEARDKMMNAAVRLGSTKEDIEKLKKIFSGELDIRD